MFVAHLIHIVVMHPSVKKSFVEFVRARMGLTRSECLTAIEEAYGFTVTDYALNIMRGCVSRAKEERVM